MRSPKGRGGRPLRKLWLACPGRRVAGPGKSRARLVGRGSLGRRGRARHDVVKRDFEAAVGGDAALGQVLGHGVPSCWGQVAGGPGGMVVVAGHGETRERYVICVGEAFGALVLRVPGGVAVVARVRGGDEKGRGAAHDWFGRGVCRARSCGGCEPRDRGRTPGSRWEQEVLAVSSPGVARIRRRNRARGRGHQQR